MREYYYRERARLGAPGEFNEYNLKKMKRPKGNAPIGADGFRMELAHSEELARNPGRSLDADNIKEIFRSQHDFDHGDLAMRWHKKRSPRSPHEANLPDIDGVPAKKHKYWP
jgi:hypothetical protein